MLPPPVPSPSTSSGFYLNKKPPTFAIISTFTKHSAPPNGRCAVFDTPDDYVNLSSSFPGPSQALQNRSAKISKEASRAFPDHDFIVQQILLDPLRPSDAGDNRPWRTCLDPGTWNSWYSCRFDPSGAWRKDRHRSWFFRTVGYGNGEAFWRALFSELRKTGYAGTISIAHEDSLMNREEGLKKAVGLVRECALLEASSGIWWA